MNGVAIDNALSKWSEVTPRSPPQCAYHASTVGLFRLVAVPVHGKEFASISYIAVSVRTGSALIFVLEYCALWDLEYNLNLRIITVEVQVTVQLSPP